MMKLFCWFLTKKSNSSAFLPYKFSSEIYTLVQPGNMHRSFTGWSCAPQNQSLPLKANSFLQKCVWLFHFWHCQSQAWSKGLPPIENWGKTNLGTQENINKYNHPSSNPRYILELRGLEVGYGIIRAELS
ncbi:unnamed protein product [Ilex paraguariensis]|uniref:Uncharacterized protein n=1 Tax=Ilex paraguariensis TaxID=185542 RepID=A0ABC8UFI3_9AQUA